MQRAVIAGPDAHDLGDELAAAGLDVSTAPGTANRPALEDAGIVDADLLVVTDTELATAIPIAKDLNENVHTVVYAAGSLPEFVKGQADKLLDPALFDPADVASELAENGG